jgi:hypothetical protein
MLDPSLWQPVLEHHASLFSGLEPGCAAALIPKPDWDAGSGTMLEWRCCGDGMRAALKPWRGAAQTDVDLLFVGLRDSFARLSATDLRNRFSLLKDMLHQGDVMFFVMKTKCHLVDSGWEDFLDTLGLAFMGACR